MKKQSSDIIDGSLWWETFILLLSIYVLLALAADSLVSLPRETSNLLNTLDTVACVFFIGDFVYCLASAKQKLAYLKWGWIDLISSIPNIRILRWGRLVRILRILRILRGIRSARTIARRFFEERALGVFSMVAIVSVFMIFFSSIAILSVEDTADSTIKSGSDALWWAFVTFSNVGDGRYYPITGWGKILSVMLTISGAALIGTFTAYVASKFLGARQKRAEELELKIESEIEAVKEELGRLEEDKPREGKDK